MAGHTLSTSPGEGVWDVLARCVVVGARPTCQPVRAQSAHPPQTSKEKPSSLMACCCTTCAVLACCAVQTLSACLLVPALLAFIRRVQTEQGQATAALLTFGAVLLLLVADTISRRAQQQQQQAQAACVTAATLQQQLQTAGARASRAERSGQTCTSCMSSQLCGRHASLTLNGWQHVVNDPPPSYTYNDPCLLLACRCCRRFRCGQQ